MLSGLFEDSVNVYAAWANNADRYTLFCFSSVHSLTALSLQGFYFLIVTCSALLDYILLL